MSWWIGLLSTTELKLWFHSARQLGKHLLDISCKRFEQFDLFRIETLRASLLFRMLKTVKMLLQKLSTGFPILFLYDSATPATLLCWTWKIRPMSLDSKEINKIISIFQTQKLHKKNWTFEAFLKTFFNSRLFYPRVFNQFSNQRAVEQKYFRLLKFWTNNNYL